VSKNILAIDIGSTKICVVIAKQEEDSKPQVMGYGMSKAHGIKRGVIRNIEQTSKSIKEALENAKRFAGTISNSATVSLSGAYTKGMPCSGVVNVPTGVIGVSDIKRAIHAARYNANIPSEFEVVHVLPFSFKVDTQESIEDPLGMDGSRLEASVYTIVAQKSAINNLRRVIENVGLKIDNFVLSAYASSLATLTEENKDRGAAVIDLGGSICNLIIHTKNSINYLDYLSVGSENITNDISIALGTPLDAAEITKREYGSLIVSSEEERQSIQLPIMGDENETKDVAIYLVQEIIKARVEETLMILSQKIDKSGLRDLLGTGVILTGGMTKIKGIREVALEIFKNLPVRIASPDAKLAGLIDDLDNPIYSTSVGLVLYASGEHTKYEIDSNNKLRYQNEISLSPKIDLGDLREDKASITQNEQEYSIHNSINETANNNSESSIVLPKNSTKDKNKPNPLSADFWKSLF
jgi:cell division protein FtsA